MGSEMIRSQFHIATIVELEDIVCGIGGSVDATHCEGAGE